MNLHARGQLQHHFWGTYAATIVLLFAVEDFAQKALAKLPGFTPHPRNPKALVFHGGGDALQAVEHLLIGYGADKKKLTSLAKSIDWGEPFVVNINYIEDDGSEQLSLLGA